MNLIEFQQASKRTMPFNGEPKNNVERENMLVNYAMGLVGESVELLLTHKEGIINGALDIEFLKEIGDVSHYVVGLAQLLKYELPEHVETLKDIELEPYEILEHLLSLSSDVSETVKKHIFHGREHPLFDAASLLEVLSTLKTITKYYGFKYSNVLSINIDKLKTRYPEKFNTADSIARKDVQG